MAGQDLVSRSMSGVVKLFAVSVIQRGLTFLVNQLLLRSVDPGVCAPPSEAAVEVDWAPHPHPHPHPTPPQLLLLYPPTGCTHSNMAVRPECCCALDVRAVVMASPLLCSAHHV
jgi:hypothetical protein